MSYEEKRAWIMAVVSVVAYAAYAIVVLQRTADTPLVEVSYAAALLWSIGGAIIAEIVLNIAASIAAPKDGDAKDQRDREIHRFGGYVGQSFLIIGAVAALVMALAELEYFWIANAIYLGFVLSAILSSVAKIVAYRRGFHPW